MELGGTPRRRGGTSLKLPGCEATDVDVELVEAGTATVMGKLNLKFKLRLCHWFPADLTRPPTPGPPQVRSGARAGSLPFWTASRACSRRRASSGMAGLVGCLNSEESLCHEQTSLQSFEVVQQRAT